MEGAACTNVALRWRRPGYIRPGIFMPPMTAFMRALAASLAARSASFTAATTISCSISTSSGSTASGIDGDVGDGHLAGGRGLYHAAAGRGLEGHGSNLLLSRGSIALHLLGLLHHFLHVHERVSFADLRVAPDC